MARLPVSHLLLAGLLLWAAAAVAGERPPALLEPFAGYDMVFGPRGERVLGPEAAPGVQAMLEAEKPTLPEGCEVGDIAIQSRAIALSVACTGQRFELRLPLRESAAIDPRAISTAHFTVPPPKVAGGDCDPTCQTLRGQLLAALIERVRAGEGAITWQQVRRQGGGGDGWMGALASAHEALATGNRRQARTALQRAVHAQPVKRLSAAQALDLALLAGEARDDVLRERALGRLEAALSVDTNTTAGRAGQAIALQILRSAGKRGRVEGLACAIDPSRCDALPAVRALAAVGRYRDAAAILDRGPLAAERNRPPMEMLKLRFGLASAARDADGELAVARRVMTAWPDSPVGADLLSSGMLRAGRYRQAIETLHELSRKHPERDIVLGRIAGMVAFLRNAASADAALNADVQAIEARMKAAAREPTDVVARFLEATRKYYSGDFEASLPELKALYETDNRDPRIPLYLAMAHFWLGHQQRAEKLIDEAVHSGPSDPDVFYCRSQIVRKLDLPQAIADLERYVEMTNRPWALNPAKKDDRVKAELDYMRRGVLPPDWDRPGPGRVRFDPANQPGTPASAAARSGYRAAVSPAGAATGADSVTATGDAPQSPGKDGDREGSQEGPDTTLPILILVALLAAIGVRLWSRGRA